MLDTVDSARGVFGKDRTVGPYRALASSITGRAVEMGAIREVNGYDFLSVCVICVLEALGVMGDDPCNSDVRRGL
jgi:hypothetical protein